MGLFVMLLFCMFAPSLLATQRKPECAMRNMMHAG